MIRLIGLTKRYGSLVAVDDLTVEVLPGRVTGFLGPNGAGKSTTLRLLLGLDLPTAGQALINGLRYRDLEGPARVVGAHLDGRTAHPGRSARAHLLGLSRRAGIPASRVEEVLDLVGLADVGRHRTGTFSLGMSQQLGIAAALLGDPQVLLLDEPVNGLDTDGVRWIRGMFAGWAAEGRTVLVSSHLLAELQHAADHLVVLGRGRLLADCPTSELVGRSVAAVRLRSPDTRGLHRVLGELAGQGIGARFLDGTLRVDVSDPAVVGDTAYRAGVPVHLLLAETGTLEDGYLRLVEDHAAHRSGGGVDVAEIGR